MVETKLHLCEKPMEVPSVDPVVAAEPGLCETPEVLDAVHVAAFSACECAVMVDAVVPVPVGDEAVVQGEGIRVDGMPFGMRWRMMSRSVARETSGTGRVYTRPLRFQMPNTATFPAAPLPRFPLRFPPKYDSSTSCSPTKKNGASSSQEQAMRFIITDET
jgi:hypothetical protein